MSCFRSIRSSILAVLIVLPQVLVADITTSGPQNACSFCYTSKCPATTCLQTCTSACPENYYQSALVCETPSTSAATATTTTASTLTTTTSKTTKTTTETTTTPATTTTTTTTPTTPTTTPTTIKVPAETNHAAANTNPGPPGSAPAGRRRRQAVSQGTTKVPLNIATVAKETTHTETVAIAHIETAAIKHTEIVATETMDTATVAITTTTTGTATVAIETTKTTTIGEKTTTVKTTPTTISLTTMVCRLCSLKSCILCQDDSQNNTICATCQDGYSPSSDQKSCSKDGLSAGAIVGIAIGVVCFVAIAVGVTIILVRRFWWRRDATDREHAMLSHSRGNNSTNSYQLSEIRTNDRSFSEDPVCERRTHMNENDSEQYEIGKLGDAPTPPAKDSSKRYDMLTSTNKDDPQPYSPLGIPNESRYANCANEEQTKNIYANQKNEDTHGASASNIPGAHENTSEASVSPEAVELYESFDTTQHEEVIQEEYVNLEALIGQQATTRAAADTQVDYYNDSNSIVDDVYENT